MGPRTLLALALVTAASSCGDAPTFTGNAVTHAQAAAAALDTTQLEPRIRAIVANRVGAPTEMNRWDFAPLERHASATYVESAFRDLGLTPVAEDENTLGVETHVLYADVRGTTHPEQYVLVTGHYDAWFGSGADDNGSAMAVALESARVIATMAPARTVRFILFDREEEGLIGSSRYQARHASDDIVMMLNMDCVAYTSQEHGSQQAPPGLALRDQGNFLAVLANGPGAEGMARFIQLSAQLPSPVDVLGLIAPGDARYPATGAFLRSDHASFWRAGVPALFLTDTANLRNPHYHSASDQPDTLDYPFLGKVARLVAAAAIAFAEAG